MSIRLAVKADMSNLVELSDMKRSEYEGYSPVFWRKATDANENQTAFFEVLLERDNVIILVHESEGGIDGFIIASIIGAPPVYDPGGKVCMIDDFTVLEPSLWRSVGRELRDEAIKLAKAEGAVLSVLVCGHLDDAKRRFLQEIGAEIASEWYIQPVG